MGKAALLIVAALSVAGTSLVLSLNETDNRSRLDQSEYSADVIAREIARSAYNGAVADANRAGLDIEAALRAVGTRTTSGCQENAAECFRRTGEMQGGTFIVEARESGGNGIEIYAAGTYDYTGLGEDGKNTRLPKTHTINETNAIDVLEVNPSGDGGLLKIQFLDSMAGYCSTILLQRTLPGVAEADQPLPEMVYAPGNSRNGEANEGYETYLAPGTQMNFAIGVENTRNKGWRCNGRSSRGAMPSAYHPINAKKKIWAQPASNSDEDREAFQQLLANYEYDENHFDWVHWALDGTALRDGEPKEGPWAMVEVDPTNDQRWRISFEDIPNWNLAADHRDFNNPNKSLWATKRFGYDRNGDGVGDGWKDNERLRIATQSDGTYRVVKESGSDGFHDLRDTGKTADFSDQVILVEVVPRDLADGGDSGGDDDDADEGRDDSRDLGDRG